MCAVGGQDSEFLIKRWVIVVAGRSGCGRSSNPLQLVHLVDQSRDNSGKIRDLNENVTAVAIFILVRCPIRVCHVEIYEYPSGLLDLGLEFLCVTGPVL